MNPVEEAAFETSIYQYFLFKANQAATAASAKAKTAPKQAPTTAANDKQSPAVTPTTANDKEDDESNKPSESDSSEKNPTEEAAAGDMPTNTDTAAASDKPPAAGMTTGQPPALAPRPPAQGIPPAGPPPPGHYPHVGQFPGMLVPPAGPPAFSPPLGGQMTPLNMMPPNMMPPNMMPPGMMPFPGMVSPPFGAPAAGMQPPIGQFPGMFAPPGVPPVHQPVPAAQQPPPPNMPPGISPSTMAEKYQKVADVIRKEFPHHASKLPANVQWIAPDVCMRYTLYPKVQHEVNFLRYQKQVEKNQESRKPGRPRKRAPSPVMPPVGNPFPALGPSPKKKTKIDTKYVRIATRKDVPEDVKELIANVKKESYSERRAMKQKIARLEAKVVLTKEKLDEKKQAPLPPPVPMPPPIPRAPPKPVGPPATFESRYKQLEDYKRANNSCRVPGRVPGLGKWVAELRKNYRQLKEDPDLPIADESSPNLMAAELTKERMDKLDELGFEWDVAKKTLPWETRFEQMMNFRAKTGHCNVPRHYKENPSLGEW